MSLLKVNFNAYSKFLFFLMKLGSFGKYKTYIQQIKYLLTCDNF